MAKLDDLLEDLVTANHVLAKPASSIRSATSASAIRTIRTAIFLSCSRAPERVKTRRHHGVHARMRSGRRQGPAASITERFIHGARLSRRGPT